VKFGIISEGPADRLIKRAKKLNPNTPVVVVDDSTYKDPEIFAVFVFKPHRAVADRYNELREKAGARPLGKGQPEIRSSVRARIAGILRDGPAYGYEIYKEYRAHYGEISLRLVYYHLKQGAERGLFEVADVKESEGDFSWGPSTRRKYYKLKSVE
jgi:hypothetical protein